VTREAEHLRQKTYHASEKPEENTYQCKTLIKPAVLYAAMSLQIIVYGYLLQITVYGYLLQSIVYEYLFQINF
jgi:hypothetical protein